MLSDAALLILHLGTNGRLHVCLRVLAKNSKTVTLFLVGQWCDDLRDILWSGIQRLL
jgi:hypothetical protein